MFSVTISRGTCLVLLKLLSENTLLHREDYLWIIVRKHYVVSYSSCEFLHGVGIWSRHRQYIEYLSLGLPLPMWKFWGNNNWYLLENVIKKDPTEVLSTFNEYIPRMKSVMPTILPIRWTLKRVFLEGPLSIKGQIPKLLSLGRFGPWVQ